MHQSPEFEGHRWARRVCDLESHALPIGGSLDCSWDRLEREILSRVHRHGPRFWAEIAQQADTVATWIIETCGRAFSATQAILAVSEDPAGRFRIASRLSNYGADTLPWPIAQVSRTREALLLNPPAAPTPSMQRHSQLFTPCIMAVPIQLSGCLIGVLYIARCGDPYTTDDLRTLRFLVEVTITHLCREWALPHLRDSEPHVANDPVGRGNKNDLTEVA